MFRVLLVLMLLIPSAGCIRHRPRPGPGPKPDPGPANVSPETAADSAVASLRAGYAKNFSSAAEKLRGGDLKTAREAFDFVSDANRKTREEAFAGVEEVVDGEIGGEKWDAGKAAKLFDRVSKGYAGGKR